MCAHVCAHQYVMWFSHIYPHLFCSPPVNSFSTYFLWSLSFRHPFLSPPSLHPALSLFLSDQVGFIRWFSVQGNRCLIRATSLKRTTFSPFPEPFNDHGEVGP